MPDQPSPVRWGIVATGRIAAAVARELPTVSGADLLAVASRDRARAEAFAGFHAIPRVYDSYDAMFADPDIDVVYIATPHAQHYQVAVAALAAGKALLVEKAFTCTVAAAEDLVSRARDTGVFVMEAMKTRFQESTLRMKELIDAGEIGEVRSVQADLGFAQPYDESSRLWDAAQGGGAMLDLGVYPVSFAQLFLGQPDSVQAVGELAPNGVDSAVAVQLGYTDGRFAQVACSLTTPMNGAASIQGTTGALHVASPFHHMRSVSLVPAGASTPSLTFEVDTTLSMVAELAEVTRCVQQGLTESPGMTLDDTLGVMRTMEIALDQVGAVHTDEGFSPLS